MATSDRAPHTLVVYGASTRADAALRELVDCVCGRGGRVTVVQLVAQEPEGRRCCDTRSVLWNEISRDLGRAGLSRASRTVQGHDGVNLEVAFYSGRAADAVVREALARDVDEVVLADAPIGPGANRRLRRISPVPVRKAA